MVFLWSLYDNKSQVSRTLLSILGDLNNAVVWMVSTCPLISSFTLWSARIAGSRFWLTITRSGRWTIWLKLGDPFISQIQRILCISFPRMDSRLCIYYLFVCSNLNFLHDSQWITFSTQSCLVLHYLNINLLHSFIMWQIILSLSPHSLRLLFCCILSILLWHSSYGDILCCYQKRFSFSLKVLLSEPCPSFLMWDFVCCLKCPYSCFASYFCSVDPRIGQYCFWWL